jgi:hypothetical protein
MSKRNVTADLPELNETCPFERADNTRSADLR